MLLCEKDISSTKQVVGQLAPEPAANVASDLLANWGCHVIVLPEFKAAARASQPWSICLSAIIPSSCTITPSLSFCIRLHPVPLLLDSLRQPPWTRWLHNTPNLHSRTTGLPPKSSMNTLIPYPLSPSSLLYLPFHGRQHSCERRQTTTPILIAPSRSRTAPPRSHSGSKEASSSRRIPGRRRAAG